jgi:hypothetical protein
MHIRETLKHKWVVPVGALIMVLAIGATAWAATGSTEGTTATTVVSSTAQTTAQTTASSTTTTDSSTSVSDLAQLFGLSGGTSTTSSVDAAAQQALELQQQRQEALLRLVRNSMSTADQTAFDQLWAQEQTKTDALQQAELALQNIKQQLQGLVDKYLPTTSTTITTVP